MNPPPHICGPLQPGAVLKLADRFDWIVSQKRAGVSQKDIAIALGVSEKCVSRLVERAPTQHRVNRISDGPGRYSVTGFVRGSKHATTIRAADRAAAEDRFRRAYPGAEVVGAVRLRE